MSGGDARRPDDVCAHRRHGSLEPTLHAGIHSIGQRDALGTPQAGPRPLTVYSQDAATLPAGRVSRPRFWETVADVSTRRRLFFCEAPACARSSSIGSEKLRRRPEKLRTEAWASA